MTITPASICSNALLMLGDKPIASFTERTDRAETAANLWPDIRDEILRAKLWTCCRKRVLLPPLSNVPAWGYTAAFRKPSDWLRTVQAGYDGEALEYRDEGGHILANVTALPLIYTWRSEDPAVWDALLVRVMTLAMAAAMAYAVTKSATVETTRLGALKEALQRAGAISGQDDGPEDFGGVDLLSARYGYRG